MVRINVESYFKGSGGSQVIVEQAGVSFSSDDAGNPVGLELAGGPNCALFNGLPVGERYLLFLYVTDRGNYSTSWCAGSLRLDASRLSYAFPGREGYVAALEEYDDALGLPSGTLLQVAAAAGGEAPELYALSTPPSEPDNGVPWLPVVLGSALAAGAVLVAGGATLVYVRRAKRV